MATESTSFLKGRSQILFTLFGPSPPSDLFACLTPPSEGIVRAQKAMTNPVVLRRGDFFGDSAVTGLVSTSTYVTSGAVVLVCIPAKEFERVLHSTDTGSKIAGTGEKLEANEEILALSKHIEQYLDVLMFFTQDTDEVSCFAHLLGLDPSHISPLVV
jgi:hypothetical protein